MPSPPLSSTSPRDWRYTAEGGANLVLSFMGPLHSPFTGYVLRLRKRKIGAAPRGADEVVPSEVEVDFGERVVAPLLGRNSVVDMHKVELERPWLEGLVRRLRDDGSRPAGREAEDEVDLDAPVGVLAEDLIAGKGVAAAEIKPKWGFLPSTRWLSPETADVKSTHCRTCMHRYYKLCKSGDEAKGHDGFCPLELYSGDEGRTRSALEELYCAWEKSDDTLNNLRLFYEGKRVSPAEPLPADSSEPKPEHPLVSAMLRLSPLCVADSHCSPLCTSLARALVASPLLSTLARLQASLDALDIEGLATLLLEHPSTQADLFAPADRAAAEVAKLGPQPSLAEWEALLARLGPALSRGREATAQALREGSPRDAVLAYLLSATLKDCSLIVRFPPAAEGGQGSVSVKAIDLDPKPIARMAKYARMDREIVECWKQRLEQLGEGEAVRRCRE